MHHARGSASLTILIVSALLSVVALLSGISYEQLGRARDRDRLPQIGRSVDIGGRTLNLYCSGEGQPTAIFESGSPWPLYDPRAIWEKAAPRPGYSWVLIQRETAKFTRACWYDRAGSGWSDLAPYPRTSAAQAHDLHALLKAAGVFPPYVLVAEASATLDAHVFAGLYPSEAVGLVFADAVHPDLFTRARPGRGRFAQLPRFVFYSEDASARLFNLIGFSRFLAKNTAPPAAPKGMTSDEWATIWRLSDAPKARTALIQDIAAWPQSADQARAAGGLGNRPFAVISSENTAVPSESRRIRQDLQTDLSRLSARRSHIQLNAGSGDLIYEAPDAIIAAVRQVVGEVNATAAHLPAARPRP